MSTIDHDSGPYYFLQVQNEVRLIQRLTGQSTSDIVEVLSEAFSAVCKDFNSNIDTWHPEPSRITLLGHYLKTNNARAFDGFCNSFNIVCRHLKAKLQEYSTLVDVDEEGDLNLRFWRLRGTILVVNRFRS